MTTDTPRTDAAVAEARDTTGQCVLSPAALILSKHARTLERDLAARDKTIETLREDAERLDWISLNGCRIMRTADTKRNLICWLPDLSTLRAAIDEARGKGVPK